MKDCNRCSRELPETSFNKNKSKKSGLADWCRECMSIYLKSYSTTDHARAMARDRFHQRYDSDPVFRESIKQSTAKKIKRSGPTYQAAHWAVYAALKARSISKPSTCERCPSSNRIQAHHDDYSRPLDVMWLCPVCHAARHKELGRLRTVAKIYDQTSNAY